MKKSFKYNCQPSHSVVHRGITILLQQVHFIYFNMSQNALENKLDSEMLTLADK
jgi:hypothetical protein